MLTLDEVITRVLVVLASRIMSVELLNVIYSIEVSCYKRINVLVIHFRKDNVYRADITCNSIRLGVSVLLVLLSANLVLVQNGMHCFKAAGV